MKEYKYRDPKVEDGVWEYVEEDQPASGFVGIPDNNPVRNPAWNQPYDPAEYTPRLDNDDYFNVEFEHDDGPEFSSALEEFLSDPVYNAVLAAALSIACVLLVWLLMVIL